MEKTVKQRLYANMYAVKNIDEMICDIESENNMIYFSEDDKKFIVESLNKNIDDLKVLLALDYINNKLVDLDVERMYTENEFNKAQKILEKIYSDKLQ